MLNKKELSKKLARSSFLTQKESALIVDEMFQIMIDELNGGEEISIVGFGRFYLYEHKPRPVRNPRTQEEMQLKSYKSVRFKSSSVVKKLLKESTYSEED